MKSTIKTLIRGLGYEVKKVPSRSGCPPDMEDEFVSLYDRCRPYSMTDPHKMYGLYKGLQHVSHLGIPGDIVECGVWKGGSAMLCALVLLEMQDTNRDLYLYDTFTGMSEPTPEDKYVATGVSAEHKWKKSLDDDASSWCYASLDEVKENLHSTGYPAKQLRFIQGKIEETVPGTMPDQIALLRLDTDWYESTRHEMIHLFPRLSRGGVLIVDDYGYWEGAKKAIDEYVEEKGLQLLFNRTGSGRLAIKTGEQKAN